MTPRSLIFLGCSKQSEQTPSPTIKKIMCSMVKPPLVQSFKEPGPRCVTRSFSAIPVQSHSAAGCPSPVGLTGLGAEPCHLSALVFLATNCGPMIQQRKLSWQGETASGTSKKPTFQKRRGYVATAETWADQKSAKAAREHCWQESKRKSAAPRQATTRSHRATLAGARSQKSHFRGYGDQFVNVGPQPSWTFDVGHTPKSCGHPSSSCPRKAQRFKTIGNYQSWLAKVAVVDCVVAAFLLQKPFNPFFRPCAKLQWAKSSRDFFAVPQLMVESNKITNAK